MQRNSNFRSISLGLSCADVLRSLGDATRLRIVELLFGGAQNVTAINSELKMEATLLSHHLRVLREAGLVEAQREGRQVIYRLSARVRSARRGQELDFGCCTLRFKS